MITITRAAALNAIRKGKLSDHLRRQGVTIIMAKEDANRWLKKLEDGTQKQAESVLYDKKTEGFCCLGLEQACNWGDKVEVDSTGQPKALPSIEYLRTTGKMYFNRTGVAVYNPSTDFGTAAGMNDSGYSFKDIAKQIRKHIAVY